MQWFQIIGVIGLTFFLICFVLWLIARKRGG